MDNWKKHFIILEQVEIEKCATWRDCERGCQHHCVDRVCSLERRNGERDGKIMRKGEEVREKDTFTLTLNSIKSVGWTKSFSLRRSIEMSRDCLVNWRSIFIPTSVSLVN